jgi:hypothetical protein
MKREADFDGSADMRLLDLQRAALGVAPPARPTWESGLDADGIGGADVPDDLGPGSATIVVEGQATPAVDVIPGAVVTLSLSVANEGVRPAHALRAGAPLPAASVYREGTFVRDGRPESDDSAGDFFGEGLPIGALEPKSRATFLWKVGIRQGTTPLLVIPWVTAGDAAVIGAQSIAISRKTGASASFANEVKRAEPPPETPPSIEELPFYELDEEETLVHEAVDAGLESAPKGIAEPPAHPAPAPAPEAAASPAAFRDAIVVSGQMDRLSLAFFERIFSANGKPPTLLNHFMLGGALACTAAADGSEITGLKQHNDAQAQLLQRIALHERLGKKEPIAEYAGTIDVRLDQLRELPVRPQAATSDSHLVRFDCDLSAPGLAVLRKMYDERSRWDFTKARQFALALQAQRVRISHDTAAAESANSALRNYSQIAGVALQRFFVRMRIDRTTALLSSNDSSLDAAARQLLSALAALFV